MANRCPVCQLYSSQLVVSQEFPDMREETQLQQYYLNVQRKWMKHVNLKHWGTSPLDQLQVQESGFKERTSGRGFNQGER